MNGLSQVNHFFFSVNVYQTMTNQLYTFCSVIMYQLCNIIPLSADDVYTCVETESAYIYGARVTMRCQSNASLGWQSETLLTLRGR